MSTKTLLSLQEFEQLPDDDLLHELDEGELITMPMPMPGHGMVQNTTAYLLTDFVRKHALGVVFTEIGFVLQADPWTVRGPDVSFVRLARAKQINKSKYIQGAPDLAIEIVSDSDKASQIARKVDLYLRFGGHTVWVIYPALQQVHVFERAGTRVLHSQERLDAPELLPGFAILVEEIFSE